MSLDKAIAHNKEKRKPYKGVKAHFTVCRNHGACDYCRLNRLFTSRKRIAACNEKLNDYKSLTKEDQQS